MDPQHRKLVAIFIVQFASLIALFATSTANMGANLNLNQNALLLVQQLFIENERDESQPGRIQSYNRAPGYADVDLVGPYNNIVFKQRFRMTKEIFMYVCQEVGPMLFKQDTNRRKAISVETRVAIAITRLAFGSSLYIIVDSYRVGISIVHAIVLDFCHALNFFCRNSFIRWPTPSRLQDISRNFEALHGIPYIAEAIDGSHISILAPREHTANYYCRKGFHSILLQGVVDHSCCFWNYDIGWCSSIHDYNLFSKSSIGKYCFEGKFNPYALLGDAAYQPRPWMLTPYLGSKDGFTCKQEHWNFIQSSSRMYVERTFGILKLRWRILLKKMDCLLQHVPAHITACLILHNLTIMHNDMFNVSWINDAQTQLQKRMAIPSDVAPASTTLLEAQNVTITSTEFYNRATLEDEILSWNSTPSSSREEMSMCRDAIAKSLFSRNWLKHLAGDQRDTHVGLTSSESE